MKATIYLEDYSYEFNEDGSVPAEGKQIEWLREFFDMGIEEVFVKNERAYPFSVGDIEIIPPEYFLRRAVLPKEINLESLEHLLKLMKELEYSLSISLGDGEEFLIKVENSRW